MRKHKNDEEILIGDDGMLKKADTVSKIFVTGCTILGLILIFLGVMAIIY